MDKRTRQPGPLLFSLGAPGVGLTGLAFGDYARQWQPVPAWVPLRDPLTYLTAGLILGAGVAALTPRGRIFGVTALGVTFALWTLLMKTPVAISAPAVLGAWLG